MKFNRTSFLKDMVWPGIAGIALATLYLDRLTLPDVQPDAVKPVVSQLPAGNVPVLSYAPAVERAMPAVVNIYTQKIIKPNPLLLNPFMRGFEGRPRMEGSLGSGVIVDARGYVLTNYHVVADAEQILVALNDGRESNAEIVGLDRETDLAVLRIAVKELQPIAFGNVQQSRIGDVVLAIGNPLGVGQTVTQGIISAAARYGLELNIQENYIQTDAAINAGNSGGALVDATGLLIGINTAIQSPTGASVGIGYAIPADTAWKVMHDIITHGQVIRGWIGIEWSAVTSYGALKLGLASGQGIVVTGVYRNGPAAKAGLQGGDVITHIDDAPAYASRVGMKRIAHAQPGEKIRVRFMRARKVFNTEVVIAVKPT
jgi:serine protease DegS